LVLLPNRQRLLHLALGLAASFLVLTVVPPQSQRNSQVVLRLLV